MSNIVAVSVEDRLQVSRVFERFEAKSRKSKKQIFYDLCFCICAPQTTFVSNRKVIAALQKADFYNKDIPIEEMHKIVKPARFYRNKTKFLLEAKEKFHDFLYENIRDQFRSDCWHMTEKDFRDYLAKNIKGLGMKAASHFCRNLGYVNVAIIDTHILKYLDLGLNDINSRPKYCKVEKIFATAAEENGFSVGEFDALLWKRYSKTPWEEFTY